MHQEHKDEKEKTCKICHGGLPCTEVEQKKKVSSHSGSHMGNHMTNSLAVICNWQVKHKKKIFIPDTWLRMRDILLYWASKGVDGFRCDMAEMVPVAFWQWAIKEVKRNYPSLIFIAEVSNPDQYRSYLHEGGFDYLYDKVGLYDTLKLVMRNDRPATDITGCWQRIDDIRQQMLNFLENHDEQRIASDFFAGDAIKQSNLISHFGRNANKLINWCVFLILLRRNNHKERIL